MMDLSKWFEVQLGSTLDGFIWAVGQVPNDRQDALPPAPLGEWSASQHIFHMLEYEKYLAFPSMHQWLGAPPPVRRYGDENDEQNRPRVEEMLAEFEHIRRAEIALLSKFGDDHGNSNRHTTFWGEVSLSWLVSKTY